MKKIIKSAFFAIILISLASCETENDNPVPVANGITLESISPNGPYVLSAEDGDNDVATLTWTKADNGVPTIPSSYVIEIAKSGTNFADPIVASTSSTDLSYKWTEGYLDPILLENGFIPDEATAIDIRIKSTLGLGSFPFIQYSNVISTSVTPFAQPSFAFAKEGDNPADAPKMISSSYFTTNCEGYAWLEPGNYKFYTSVKNEYQSSNPYYGDNGSGGLELNGAPITISTAGFYYMKADTNLKTYSVTLSEWGIFGLATPFPSAVNKKMTYNPETKQWEITVLLSGGKAFKFRNKTSTSILGKYDSKKVGDEYAGKAMSYNGIDIVLAGTTPAMYKITLDLNTPRAYTYTLTKQ